ncbi:hypothetical protein CDN98_19475 [Roseateles terrae]|nr:hypothetical protein CDN98_19475 [Roseateles terrae]
MSFSSRLSQTRQAAAVPDGGLRGPSPSGARSGVGPAATGWTRPLTGLCATAVAAMLALTTGCTALAEPPEQGRQSVQGIQGDVPTRAGRVAEVSSGVWIYDPDGREWLQLQRNQSVGEGDRIRTDERAGVTLTIGSSTLWVDERSEIEFNALAEQRVSVQIVRGGAGVRLRSPQAADEWTFQTLEGRVSFEREGLYRVSQLDRGTQTQAWQGKLRFDSRAMDVPPVFIATNEQAEFWWDNGPRTERQPLQRDAFAQILLTDERAAIALPVPANVVSPEMTGVEELSRYGTWQQSPEYGQVWVPTTVIVDDWAPYRYGRWVWSSRWGYTWVDDMPWGFAPFHYGRWAYWGNRWCWVPGPYEPRPAYAPAVVGWVGGAGLSINVWSGGRRPPPPRYGAWVPLAPREAYYPPGRYSNDYWRRVNPRIEPGRVPRPNDPVPPFRYEREHGGLFNPSRPVTRPLPVVEPRTPMRSGPDRPGGVAGGRPDGRNDNRNDGRWDGRPDGRPGGTPPGQVRPIAVPAPAPNGVRPFTGVPDNAREERSPRDERWQPQRRDDGNEPGRRDDGRFGVPVQNRPEPRNDMPRYEPPRSEPWRGDARGQPIREPIRENREPPRMEAPRPVMAPPQPQMQPPPQMQPQPQAPRVEPPRRENGVRPVAVPPQAAQPARPAAEPMRQRGEERRQSER